MTDLEISKALALAIGWDRSRMAVFQAGVPPGCEYLVVRPDGFKHGRPFDYRDWNVIGPIAAAYNKFPYAHRSETGQLDGKWVAWPDVIADTPQKAIALAVIGIEKMRK